MIKAVLFDLDGTLVDSNDLHLDAWDIVFRDAGHSVARDAIRGQIGKGGDLLVPTLVPGLDEDAEQALADAHGRIFKDRFLDRVRPFAQAAALVERVHASGSRIVLASSASRGELDHYVDLLGIGDYVNASTTSDDVETTKPAPDIFLVGLEKLDGIAPAEAIVIGDTPFDIEAAGKAGMRALAVRSGGFDDAALSGAAAIYDDAGDLLSQWQETLLAG